MLSEAHLLHDPLLDIGQGQSQCPMIRRGQLRPSNNSISFDGRKLAQHEHGGAKNVRTFHVETTSPRATMHCAFSEQVPRVLKLGFGRGAAAPQSRIKCADSHYRRHPCTLHQARHASHGAPTGISSCLSRTLNWEMVAHTLLGLSSL